MDKRAERNTGVRAVRMERYREEGAKCEASTDATVAVQVTCRWRWCTMFYDVVPADKHAVSRHGLHYINKSNQRDANIPHAVIFN